MREHDVGNIRQNSSGCSYEIILIFCEVFLKIEIIHFVTVEPRWIY